MRVELLMDLRAPPGVVEALVHAQRQLAEFVGRLVVTAHRSDRDGVRHVAVGGLFHVAVGQREAHHRGGDEACEERISHDVRGGPDVGQNVHDHPDLGIGHDREINERADAAGAQQPLDGSDLALQRGLLLVGRMGEGDAEETQAVSGAGQGIRIARQVLVLDASQAVDPRLVQLGRRMPEEQREFPLRLVEPAAQIQALGALEVQGKRQTVVGVPQHIGHDAHSRLQIAQRRCVGGRGLGLLPGAQVQPRERHPLRIVRDQVAAEIEVLDDVEDALVELDSGTVGQHEPPHGQVHLPLGLVRDQRVRRLLHAVVEELVGRGRARGRTGLLAPTGPHRFVERDHESLL